MNPTHRSSLFARALGAAITVAVALALGGAGTAGAQTVHERRRELRTELDRLPVAHGVAFAALRAAEDEARRLDGAAKALDGKVHERSAWLAEARRDADRLVDAEVDAAVALAEARADLRAARRELVGTALGSYALGAASGNARIVALTKGDVPALAHATAAALTHLAQRGPDPEVRAASERREAASEHYEEVREQAHEALRLARDIAGDRDRFEAERARVGRLRAEAHERAAELRGDVEQLRGLHWAMSAEIAWIDANPMPLEAELAAHHHGQPKRKASRGTITSPLPGVRVNSNFGLRVHPVYGTARWHTGVDLAAPAGTPVLAAAGGKVFSASERGGYGTTVVIDHGKSTATLYAHLSGVAVHAGDRVRRGQVIGWVGSTGVSTGPHLHLEVRQHGRPDDPANWLRY